MAQLNIKNRRQMRDDTPASASFSALAPSAILTPQRLRDRELARANQTPHGNDSPALQELRMFLKMQGLSGTG